MTYRNNKDKVTTIIFGKQELKPDEMKFLQGLRFVSLKYNEDLHAKCYANDDKMIITSLNLYEFSMANNKEMGVLIDKNESTDISLFEDAMKEVDFINETSQRFELNHPKPSFNKPIEYRTNIKNSNTKTGYCIRTGVTIPFNIERPLCAEAFKIWNQWGDRDFAEQYCHFSGEKSNGQTSMNRPILNKNWKKAKETFNL